MNDIEHKNHNFFVGPCVEHTPAFSKRTLFVVGKQDVAAIEKYARDFKTPHISLGAKHSFNLDTADNSPYWNETITKLLDAGFWVTFDYPAHQHVNVLTMLTPGVWQCRNFVPLLSVRIPSIEISSPNLTVKIADIEKTNPGVWCIHYHEITDSNRFTGWGEYETSSVYANRDDLVPTPTPAPTPIPVVAERKLAEVEATPTLNDAKLGLDTESKSSLKPDLDSVARITDIVTPLAAADAYAEGATRDPLGKEGSSQPKTAKKVAK